MGWTTKEIAREYHYFNLNDIKGKERPRATTRNGHAIIYTPRPTKKAEEEIRNGWIEKAGIRHAKFDGPVEIEIAYTRRLFKSNPVKWIGRPDLRKPDVDNVLKLVMDALTGIAFKDDRQVIKASITKMGRVSATSPNQLFITVKYFEEQHQ